MEDLRNKVAVITGAARGIGLALARKACQEGMKVVLADTDRIELHRAEQDLRTTGAQLLTVQVDVGDAASVDDLARSTYSAFGAVHLLCNNAGIGTPEDIAHYVWEVPRQDWERTIRVNLWGAINGCLSFIPRMIEQGTECDILNTASIAGLQSGSMIGVYRLTKHALVSLSESLSAQLREAQTRIHVSVLCPGFVATSLVDAAKVYQPVTEAQRQRIERLVAAVEGGTDPNETAAAAFRGLREGWLYIVPHGDSREGARARSEAIVAAYDEQHPGMVH